MKVMRELLVAAAQTNLDITHLLQVWDSADKCAR